MNNKSIIKELHKIMYLPREERNNNLKKILKKATVDDKMFLSLLILIRDANKNRITKPKVYIDSYEYSLLMFIYHMTTTSDLNLALSYLPKEEYQVAISIIKGKELPLVEILEHIDIVYTLKDIVWYTQDKNLMLLYEHTLKEPPTYVIKGKVRTWTNTNTQIPNNSVLFNGVRYNYTKELKNYILGKAAIFPKELLILPTIRPKNTEGKYLISYTLKYCFTNYIEYSYEICKPKDWVVDTNYEAIGVTYNFNGSDRIVHIDVTDKTLDSFSIKVFHTKRGKVIRCEIQDLT